MLTIIYGIDERAKLRALRALRGMTGFKVVNPECNLHPRLQLRIAEDLVTPSAIDTVVSTNSDLIVRRCMRQQVMDPSFALRIVFVPEGGEPMELSIQGGRIKDWPAGFMDDDVRESRALIDAMYAHRESDQGYDD